MDFYNCDFCGRVNYWDTECECRAFTTYDDDEEQGYIIIEDYEGEEE